MRAHYSTWSNNGAVECRYPAPITDAGTRGADVQGPSGAPQGKEDGIVQLRWRK